MIDAPPQKLEVQLKVEIYDPKRDCHRPLEEISPVVRMLAATQFDDYVKRVRVFIHPDVARTARQLSGVDRMVEAAIDDASG